ncbi:MAG: hypothetical protein ACOCZK_01065 [Planctomycetota bacterium]
MAFKDKLSTLFGRKDTRKEDSMHRTTASESAGQDQRQTASEDLHLPSPATEEERLELIRNLRDDFSMVGKVLDRLEGHLQSSFQVLRDMHQSQQRLPELFDRQDRTADEAAAAARAGREALEAMGDQLRRRDEGQAAMIRQMEDMTRQMQEQRQYDKDRAELLKLAQRSGRRLTAMVVFLLFLLFVAVLALLLAVALGLGPFQGRFGPLPARSNDPAATSAAPGDAREDAIREAATSADPLVRARAEQALQTR